MLPVIILAGGLATRLHPLTQAIPKSLIDVNGEPFIAHQLRLLQRNGIRKVMLCIGHMGEQVQDYVRDGSRFDLQVAYSSDGDRLLGTAGAVKKALSACMPPILNDSMDLEQFFVLYGDSYLPCDYRLVQEHFERALQAQPDLLALMTVHHNRGQWDASNVEFRSGEIHAYDKKNHTPQMEHIDYGLGVFQRQAFDLVPENTHYDLAGLYQQILNKNKLAGLEVPQRFYEIGSLKGLDELRQYLRHPSRRDI